MRRFDSVVRAGLYPGLCAGLCSLLLSVSPAATALAQERGSAIQCSSDGGVLINKDVGAERWAITYRPSNGFTTGNVYTADGDAVFLECSRLGFREGSVELRCGTSASCTPDLCPFFEPIGDVAVPCSFFTTACSKSASSVSRSATCGGEPPLPPYDSEASCEAFANRYGCYEYTFDPGVCRVRFCCSDPDCDDP